MKAFSRIFLIIAGIAALAAGGYKAYLLFKPVIDGGTLSVDLTFCLAAALAVVAIIAGIFGIFLARKLPGTCLFIGIILIALGVAVIGFNGFNSFIDGISAGSYEALLTCAAAPLLYLIASLFNRAFAKK